MIRTEAEQRGYEAGRSGLSQSRGHSLDLEWLRGYYEGAEAAREEDRKMDVMRDEMIDRDRSFRIMLCSMFLILLLLLVGLEPI
ncbi:hypothetical protein [Caballeronia sp. DA-9]|uniref:hypothetical protein n=1 Tax=Caballeronia sp. DA-9 TaxID=3436237 RepID=UPI003F67725F